MCLVKTSSASASADREDGGETLLSMALNIQLPQCIVQICEDTIEQHRDLVYMPLHVPNV